MGRLRPSQRVRGTAEFRRAQRLGKKLVAPNFVLLVYARDEDDRGPARLGLVVSKRVGNAVRRNRVKRLIREAFRSLQQLRAPGIDFLFIARPTLAEPGIHQLLHDVEALEQPIGRRVQLARREREIRQSRLAKQS